MPSRVLVTDYAWASLAVERAILADVGAELLIAEGGDEAELVELAAGCVAILTNWRRVPATALERATDCLVVSRYGVGVDNIPVERATELGIVVANVPDFCLDEVADHAMALLLACARRLPAFAASTRSGRWNVLDVGHGLPRLHGQTLGLVGYGNIARRLASRARAFGLRVLAHTPRIASRPPESGVETTASLERLLAESDYVSLHAPSMPETRGLIGEAELCAMKRSAYLINTARGALIDERALERALRRGRIAGAALDVLAEEPPAPDHPLLALENVIVTPHAAFYSEAAIAELQEKAARNVAEIIRGRRPQAVVNPEVLERARFRSRRATL
jgi:D-3-phosphoglycerate dehydrogenase